MVTIQEPCFCFQIKGKDVILEVTFVAAVTDCLQYFGQWQILKESQMLTQDWRGENGFSDKREECVICLIISLDCPLRMEALAFHLLSTGLAGSDCSRCEANLGRGWGRVQWSQRLRYISTWGEVKAPFPLAPYFLVTSHWLLECPALFLLRTGSGNYLTGKCVSQPGSMSLAVLPLPCSNQGLLTSSPGFFLLAITLACPMARVRQLASMSEFPKGLVKTGFWVPHRVSNGVRHF